MQRAEARRKKRLIKQRLVRRAIVCAWCFLALAVVLRAASFGVRHLFQKERRAEAVEEKPGQTAKNLLENTETLSEDKKADILLVNKEHPLADDYEPQLIKMRAYGVEVDASVYEPLQKMLAAGEQQGLSFWVASGYRSMARQRELLDEDIEELVRKGYSYSEAYEEVVRETMPVGCSEHATGLSVDIVSKNYQILDQKQAKTAEIQWLQENCSQYGFILRYPEGKEDITKVAYESWHFRYVGEEAAREIISKGLTLEEYLDSESMEKS